MLIEGRSNGMGYLIDGTPYNYNLTTGRDTWSNPTTSLTKITYFNKFNVAGALDGTGIGVSGEVKYKNTRYGTTDQFSYGFTVK